MGWKNGKPGKVIKTFSASERDLDMLEAVARYHGFSKSGTITSLVRKEFWRIFPAGNERVKPDRGAKVEEGSDEGRTEKRR